MDRPGGLGRPDRRDGQRPSRDCGPGLAAGGTLGALAAKQATKTIPIVCTTVGDPVTSGLVTSLARPGGNVTGLSVLAPELVSKRLELLTQAVPGVSRVAVLWQPGALEERTEKDRLQRAEVAGRALGVRLQFVEARDPKDLDGAFSDVIRAHAGAVTDLEGNLFFSERRRLVDLAAKNRLPAVYASRESVDAGGHLRTAKALNLTLPAALLGRADEVIQ